MRTVFVVGWNLLAVSFVLMVAEVFARWIEPAVPSSTVPLPMIDRELGWSPQPNARVDGNSREFNTKTETTELGLYDFAAPPDVADRLAILALGDSHTAATGVSTGETWPKVLQDELDKSGLDNWVYNGAVHGYSLDQYLVRFRRLAPILRPRVVLIGFSMATDFYDLGRNEDGSFVYGDEASRVYFSVDATGTLMEHRELLDRSVAAPSNVDPSLWQTVRYWLDGLAIYRLAKRSSLAFWITAKLGAAGVSLWPGLDTGLKINPSPDDIRRLILASALIGEIARESRTIGALPVLVHIPYLAQVYDSVWEQSFGTVDGYDRRLGGERLAAIAHKHGLVFVDALPAMIAHVRQTGGWVHHRIDSHPTATGQKLIAFAVFESLQQCFSSDQKLSPRGGCNQATGEARH